MIEHEFIDKKELCRRLKYGKTKVEKLQRERKIPFIKEGPSRRATVRFDYPKVVKALARFEIKPII